MRLPVKGFGAQFPGRARSTVTEIFWPSAVPDSDGPAEAVIPAGTSIGVIRGGGSGTAAGSGLGGGATTSTSTAPPDRDESEDPVTPTAKPIIVTMHAGATKTARDVHRFMASARR